MCGIVGYLGRRDCTEVLMDGLEKLEYRGYDSAGIAVFEERDIKTVKTRGKLSAMKEKLEREGRPLGHCGIGHTRWATHGEPSDANSHPHSNGRVTIVHNGIIENYAELKEFLTEKGYTFLSQTDSEVVACMLDYYYAERNPLHAITETIKELRGSYALGIIFKDFPERVYAARRGSPLIVGIGKGESFIASDIPAFLKYTKDYVLLEDNEIVRLDTDGVMFFDVHGIQISKQRQTAEWDIEQAQKLGFPHYMLKEIHEQPEVVQKTLDSLTRDGVPDFTDIGLTDELLRGVRRVYITACGTAMYAGIVARYAIEKLARVPVACEIASEFRYMDPIVGEEDLVIVVSQSGETADTKAAREGARRENSRGGERQILRDSKAGGYLHKHSRGSRDRGRVHQGVFRADRVAVSAGVPICVRPRDYRRVRDEAAHDTALQRSESDTGRYRQVRGVPVYRVAAREHGNAVLYRARI